MIQIFNFLSATVHAKIFLLIILEPLDRTEFATIFFPTLSIRLHAVTSIVYLHRALYHGKPIRLAIS